MYERITDLFLVNQTSVPQLKKQMLRPPIVRRITRAYFAVPVKVESHVDQLSLHVGDVAFCPDLDDRKFFQEWERRYSMKEKRVRCTQNVSHATAPYPRRQVLFHGGVFRGQSERVPPHRVNYLKKFTPSYMTQLSQTNLCGRTYLVALKFPHSGHAVADGVHSDMTWFERIMQKVIAECYSDDRWPGVRRRI